MGRLVKITQNVVKAEGIENARIRDTVYVGKQMLFGEIVNIEKDEAEIQMYESAEGLMLGEPVKTAGGPLSMGLGPGLLGGIFDGLGRPLTEFDEYIKKGARASVSSKKQWKFKQRVKKGENVSGGDILGVIDEDGFETRILVPPGVEGTLKSIHEGTISREEECAVVMKDGKKTDVPFVMQWPVHKPLPYALEKLPIIPLMTRQRIVDVIFPIAKGGSTVLPGGFGVGKTVLGHQLAKGSDADIVVYVGCGERGNEMADLLRKFTGTELMKRMVLIANTSNMPVAAREASIYTGATIAEFYRNMGYHTLLIADSTSRWAEALREISGSMGEMPGEKGFPSYISSRIAKFFERAGRVEVLGSPKREGSLTIMGMTSPAGGDFSEPVTQAGMQYAKALWALDPELANRRHFPAINWTTSYSAYTDDVEAWWRENVGGDWFFLRQRALNVLAREDELRKMIQIVGKGALSNKENLLLETARRIREAFLQQNAYDPVDSVCGPRKSLLMLEAIFIFNDEAEKALSEKIPLEKIMTLPVRRKIDQSKRVEEKGFEKYYQKLLAGVFDSFDKLRIEAKRRGVDNEKEI